ncbi:peptidoglycan-recognition protein SC2-like [Venturia canescens]|uniref:peptidoglycan-recognition protein SC2-like n=1 Tax=Venturia canescens TaxID=32260 RepID=UPI001C9D3EBE|nr:peptidoglycan-recognition protein SC2-like [Venturia canescens]
MFDLKTVLLIILPIVCIEGQEIERPLGIKDKPNIITRAEWGAREPTQHSTIALQTPVTKVIVHHTTKESCTSKVQCIEAMKATQNYLMDHRGMSDVSYNFYVGEDGNVYEGRGWDVAGDHVLQEKHESIGICLIGSFRSREPNEAAVNAVHDLIADGVALGKITRTYRLLSYYEVSLGNSRSKSKNSKLTKLVQSWPHGKNHWTPHAIRLR